MRATRFRVLGRQMIKRERKEFPQFALHDHVSEKKIFLKKPDVFSKNKSKACSNK